MGECYIHCDTSSTWSTWCKHKFQYLLDSVWSRVWISLWRLQVNFYWNASCHFLLPIRKQKSEILTETLGKGGARERATKTTKKTNFAEEAASRFWMWWKTQATKKSVSLYKKQQKRKPKEQDSPLEDDDEFYFCLVCLGSFSYSKTGDQG